MIQDGFGGIQAEAAQGQLDSMRERLAKIEEEATGRNNDLDDAGMMEEGEEKEKEESTGRNNDLDDAGMTKLMSSFPVSLK